MTQAQLMKRIVKVSPAQVFAATVAELWDGSFALFRKYQSLIATAIQGAVAAAAFGIMTVQQALAVAVPAVTAALSKVMGLNGLGDTLRSLVGKILIRLT